LLWCRAMLDTNTFSVADNSVEVIWASDTPCLVFDNDGNPFYQVLSFNPTHVRMARLESGAPVLDNHKRDGSITEDQLGVVENARLMDDHGRARLRFSTRPAIADFVKDVKEGIIKGISAGFRVLQYRNITNDGDRYPTLLAIDWEPFEISPVAVQEDYKCHVRSMAVTAQLNIINKNNNKNMTETEAEKAQRLIAEEAARNTFVTEERTRSLGIIGVARLAGLEPSFAETHITAGTALETFRSLANNEKARIEKPETAAEKAIREAAELLGRTTHVADERTRSLAILSDVAKAGLTAEFAEKHITDGTPLDTFRALVITEFANKQENMINGNGGRVAIGADKAAAGRLLGLEEALTIRSFGASALGEGGPKTEYGKNATGGRRVTLADHGAFALEAIGVDIRSMSEGDIFTRAMATGDFPIALSNVMNKNLRQRYQQATPQWQRFAKKVSAKDFKKIFGVQVDGNMQPAKINEKGEYPNVSFKEAGDSFQLATYGLTMGITRQMFINDDLGAFEDFAPLVSDGFIYNQTKIVYDALLGANGLGRTIGEDSETVFHADHKNLAAVGSVMSLNSLNAAKVAMRRQLTLAKRKMNNNIPAFLVIPPELEVLAMQLIHSTITPNTTSGTNPLKGFAEILVEDFFDNTTRWLLVSDKVESVKFATLDGQEGIFTEQWWEPGKDTWKMKARNDFDATVEEFRGLYNNPGA
jgi:hypothetical protein